MELKPLPIEIDNFEKLITRGCYFIDKTLLIKDILDNKADVCQFIYKTKRFGKTLNMSMLQYFFEGLNIMDVREKYTSHIGQYPVINLSLKSAKQPTFELAYISIRRRRLY